MDEYKEETDRQLIETLVDMWRKDAVHFENLINFLIAIIQKAGELAREGNYTPLQCFMHSGNPKGEMKLSPIRNTSPVIHKEFELETWNLEFRNAMIKLGVEFGATESEELREEHQMEEDAPLMGWGNINKEKMS
ncbi:MAG: hypothetical protein HQ580_19275 [Planctomycetes bacterium]|nr:hypothetical protein [Planctomycetota bacterium]